MSLLPIGIGSSGSYEIEKSLRFRASASAYLSRTPGVAGNRRTWTWSGWVKRGLLGATSYTLFSAYTGANDRLVLRFDATAPSDTIRFFSFVAGLNNWILVTSQVFRDPSAWVHIVAVLDTANATADDRARLYVNGERVTAFSTQTNPSLNVNTGYVNAANAHEIGGAGLHYLDGYLSEINFIDGQALDPSSFGEINPDTGVWVPKKYTGTYGTNGFYLPFNDGTNLTNLCLDRSGNGNNWTATNVSLTAGSTYDWMDDTPTNNFAVLNPLTNNTSWPAAPISGNLAAVMGGTSRWSGRISSVAVSSGKWYFEGNTEGIGIFKNVAADLATSFADNNQWPGKTASEWSYSNDGSKYNGNSGAAYGATYTPSDTVACAFDADAGTLTFYKNNVSQGVAYTGLGGQFFLMVYGANSVTSHINFGQRPFTYTPPTGFKALCTKNLPVPTIQNPRLHFDVTTYTGTGASRSITGLGFAPDLVWMKSRGRAVDHALYDSVRGAQLQLESNQTGTETTESTGLTAFNSDGWTMGALDQINGTTATNSFVGWAWKANGAAVTNTAGTITSQVSANTTAGFSIVTYTGTGANATVGHGLGVAPKMVIVKNRTTVGNHWFVYHANQNAAPASGRLLVSDTGAFVADAGAWNNTPPTSVAFSVGSGNHTNQSTNNLVAYCFAEVAGFSKIGSYTGNGSADGPFVYCGFRPRWVMIKSAGEVAHWYILDAARDTYNIAGNQLQANLSNAEGTNGVIDFTSNGFKIRNSSAGAFNGNGVSHIFIAFAEQPFAAPSNAR